MWTMNNILGTQVQYFLIVLFSRKEVLGCNMKVDVTKQAISGMREAAHNFVLSEATTLIVLGNGGMSI